MAKKSSSTKSSVASSSKTSKSPKVNVIKAADKIVKSRSKAPAKKKTSAKTKSSARVSYKQEYIKLLQKTNKLLTKEVKDIKKAIKSPQAIPGTSGGAYEAFPKEEPVKRIPTPPVTPPQKGSIEQQILDKLIDLEIQVRSRDMAFEDLVSGSPKLDGDY